MTAATQLLDYCASNPNATIRYHASDMILHIDSDVSYLSETDARSRAAGYHYLSNRSPDPALMPPPLNGPIHILCHTMNEVLSSASEAELGALFHNLKDASAIRTSLEEMGHPQPPTPVQTDNNTAVGIANDTVKQRRSKAIDMRFYWVRDRVRQKQFHIYWVKGSLNKADYFTKHHPATHHRQLRSTYLYEPQASKNYFDCLRNAETNQPPTDTTILTPSACDKGVLISSPRNPDLTLAARHLDFHNSVSSP
jgi:hypothetical protein